MERMTLPLSWTTFRRPVGFAAAALFAPPTLAALALAHSHLFLVNKSPSEPPGLYIRAKGQAVRPGVLAAFPAPPAAFPYADRRLAVLHRIPILKAMAAGAGDMVCTEGGELVINGRPLASIKTVDPHGVRLPRWNGCRRLQPGEAFAFSARVPTSFDSRYYGPIAVASAQVYRPLVTVNGWGK